MEDYDLLCEKNEKRNEKFINQFESWLNEKGLVKKTIRKHVSNIELYLNNYLTYYDITKMEDGIHEIDSFLGDWFIRKCIWSSKTSIKETAASIKKFYKCMEEYKYISKENYQLLCDEIKDNMEDWLDLMEEYDSEDFYDWI